MCIREQSITQESAVLVSGWLFCCQVQSASQTILSTPKVTRKGPHSYDESPTFQSSSVSAPKKQELFMEIQFENVTERMRKEKWERKASKSQAKPRPLTNSKHFYIFQNQLGKVSGVEVLPFFSENHSLTWVFDFSSLLKISGICALGSESSALHEASLLATFTSCSLSQHPLPV